MTEGKTFTEMLPEFAKEAETNPKWWTAFEKQYGNGWATRKLLSTFVDCCSDTRYRRKPRVVERTISHPEPLREAPRRSIYLASPTAEDFHAVLVAECYTDETISRWLERGLLHATPEAATAHGRALAGVEE